jgi:hypothetical protein
MTPLYKALKSNGTSFYAFPGAAEDISAAYQNQNYKMYFSKFVLLNFPKQDLTAGLDKFKASPVQWDFDNSFKKSTQTSPATSYKDQLVESLRNYVANFEVTMKESRLNNTEYYYDNNVLDTPTEKIFWKWCKSLNLFSLEQAIDGDEYFGNLDEFTRENLNDDSYFPEFLWKERTVKSYDIVQLYQSNDPVFSNKMEMEFMDLTNYRPDDIIEVSGFSDIGLLTLFGTFSTVKILKMIEPDTLSGNGQRAVLDIDYSAQTFQGGGIPIGTSKLHYHRLVRYIGEVNGVNNVQDKTRSYTEVYSHIPDHTGQTPDVLFRTKVDKNYKPDLIFPILPAQYQPEIVGAEFFNSPIVNSPQNYPGNYYGQFDTLDFTYEISSGDSERRSGDYFGITGDILNPVVNPSKLDGLSLDFDTSHYVKMNIVDRVIPSFEQFNSIQINGQPPKDFEFNAILWYYTVEDLTGVQVNNLYGISILDNPDNNTNTEEFFGGNGLRIPLFKKLAANDNQDGTSYAFSLNLNFNIINENPQDAYNPEAINSLFSFNLYNQAMSNLARINESFTRILSNQNKLETDIVNLKQLLYTQTDLQLINNRISNLENLLKLYSTNQFGNSDSITVNLDSTQTPPVLRMNTNDTNYSDIIEIKATSLYSSVGNIPFTVNIPNKKSILLRVINDDITNLTLPNNQKLEIILNSDLSYKQSIDIVVDATDTATQNKQLDVYIRFQYGTSTPVETKIMETIDLPIYYNNVNSMPNTAKIWKEVNFEVDIERPLQLVTGDILEVPVVGNYQLIKNSFERGDTFIFGDFIVGTVSEINFSGQYPIANVDTMGYLYFNVTNNRQLINYGASSSLPLKFNATQSTYLLSNKPHLKLNKGMKFKISRISESQLSELKQRYSIQREMY